MNRTSRITALIMAAALSCAADAALNDTGMTQCRKGDKTWSANCESSGQDAQYGRDVESPFPGDGVAGFSFKKVCHSGERAGEGSCPVDPSLGAGNDEWGCTEDDVTGLTWEIKTDDGGTRDRDRFFSNLVKGQPGYGGHDDAAGYVDEVNATGLCGATNWRMPSSRELQGLLNYGAGAPGGPTTAIDLDYFPLTGPEHYWSGSAATHAKTSKGWLVSFYDGNINFNYRDRHVGKVRLVRGAKTDVTLRQRFKFLHGGSEVTDALTGLIWRRCTEGMRWDAGTGHCTGEPKALKWLAAIAHAQDYAAKTGQPWRVPNIKELSSLIDERFVYPSIDPAAFPDTPGNSDLDHRFFISSTPWASVGIQDVSFKDGQVFPGVPLRVEQVLRLVRQAP